MSEIKSLLKDYGVTIMKKQNLSSLVEDIEDKENSSNNE
jgi:hypothetical protein